MSEPLVESAPPTRPRSRHALAGVLVLLALAVTSGVSYFALPTSRARSHLRRVTPAEVRFNLDAYELKGHAQAFAESPVAKDLLVSDLLPLAREEAERDDGVAYRLLAFLVAREVWPARPREFVGSKPYWSAARVSSDIPFAALSDLALSLRSRDAGLRAFALPVLPRDPRILELVVGHFGALTETSSRRHSTEVAQTLQWLADFSDGNGALTHFEETLDEGHSRLDAAWALVQRPGTDTQLIKSALHAWLDAHRSQLPPQIH